VLAAQAPDLHEALQQAKDNGASHVILDGKLFASDRLGEQTTSVKGKQIDAWYSGKAREQGGNIQALSAPDGFPLWVSEVEPGSVHDMRAARTHALAALYWAASQLNLPTLADGGYDGAGIGVFTPVKQPTDGHELDINTRTYNALLRGLRCLGERRPRAPRRPLARASPYHHQPSQDRRHRQSRARAHPVRARSTHLKLVEITSMDAATNYLLLLQRESGHSMHP